MFWVRHFTTTEHNRNLHLRTSCQESHNVLLLGGVIPNINFGAKLHFLSFNLALILASLLCLNGLVILKLAIVHNAANRWLCLRCDLYQIVTLVIGDALRLLNRKNSQLGSVVGNQTAFLNLNGFIEPWFLSCYGAHLLLSSIRCYHAQTQITCCIKKPAHHTIAGHTNTRIIENLFI